MQVKNDSPSPVIAVCSFSSFGEGKYELIRPSASKQILGPPISKIEGRVCYAVITGVIICHDNPDNTNGFVTKGYPLHIKKGNSHITIMHHLDVEEYANKQSLCDVDQK
jgi:hypothetical protein